MIDAYAVCKYIRHYTSKNGYLPRRGMVDCTKEEEDLLVKNGVIQILPLYEGGPPIAVALTEKGERMASGQRRRR
jgi:hypothetical protein